MLKLITVTGADDRTDIEEMHAISRRYPLVEWGILFSQSRAGTPRYPSADWVQRLLQGADATMNLNLSAHLCGQFVRDIMERGVFSWGMLDNVCDGFDRIQLNFPSDTPYAGLTDLEDVLMESGWYGETILQCNGQNDDTIRRYLLNADPSFSPLFDTSGGAGQLRREWPKIWPTLRCGYAGGLGPANIVNEWAKIDAAAVGGHYWIDMETHVRSSLDAFDTTKVIRVLDALK